MERRKPILAAFGLLAALSVPAAGADDFFIRVELSVGSAAGLGTVAVSPEPVVTITPRGTLVVPERLGNEGAQGAGSLSAELAEIYRLSEVSRLAQSTILWDGTMDRLPGVFVLEREVFRIDLDPRFLPPDRMKLGIRVSRVRNKAGDLDRLLDTDLVATLDDPVVAGFAYRGQQLFLSLEVSKTRPGGDASGTGARRARVQGRAETSLPVRRVEPKAPEGVDLASLSGEVVLRVSVGGDGLVTEIEVLKSLQPEVDRETVKAVKEWVFEPGLGPKTFVMTFRYGTRRRH
jgi:TonB family protein